MRQFLLVFSLFPLVYNMLTAQFQYSVVEICRQIIGLSQEQEITGESHNIHILYKFISFCLLNNKHVTHYSHRVGDKRKISSQLSSGHTQCIC
jgi:hypothetical protein